MERFRNYLKYSSKMEIAADVFISGLYGVGIAFMAIVMGSFCFDLIRGVIAQWF